MLQGADTGDYLRAALVAVLATGAALLLAVRGVARRGSDPVTPDCFGAGHGPQRVSMTWST
ncbi:hypothetical protein [Blastococcus sp. SYSU DS0533]